MKKIAIWILLGITIFMVTSCSREGSIDDTGRFDIYCVVANGVPYAGDGDLMLDFVWHKETDSYGRELFLYQSELLAIGGRQDIWVISQKTDNEQVYYYEDFFYFTYPNGGSISDENLALLKERNDWNKPIDESKMTGIYYQSDIRDDYADYYFEREQGACITDYFRRELNLPDTLSVIFDGLGTDADGGCVFLVLTRKGNTHLDVVGRYLARIDAEWDPNSIEYISIEEGYNIQEEVHSFRYRTGSDSLP